jgi:hypothetical protein
MDDFEPDFHDVDFLPGVDLYLWLRLVLLAAVAVTVGLAAALH